MNRSEFAPLGFGVGLRRPHYVHILERHPPMDWFEVISENFMVDGGRPLEVLEGVRAHYPVVMHGVSLSIGSEWIRAQSRLSRNVARGRAPLRASVGFGPSVLDRRWPQSA